MPFTFKLAKRLARLKHVVLPVLAMLASCEQPVRQATGPDPSNTPVNVLVSPDSVALDPGQTQQFQAHGRTAAGDTVPVNVNWSASLGTVTQSGLYTADTSASVAVVTATLSAEQLTGTAKVMKRRMLQIVLIPSGMTLPVGGVQQFSVYGRNNIGDSVAVSVSYAATGGTITQGGVYTAPSVPGALQVIAKQKGGSLADTAPVVVTNVPVASVSVSPATASVLVGGTVQLTATPKDSAGNPLTGRSITWASSNPVAATVNGSGLVTGAAVGTATITATSEGKSGTATVAVSLVPVASVTVSPATASILVGGTVQLTATPKDSAGNPLSGRSITWTSGDPMAGTVNGNGLVTGVAAGAATITATSEQKSAAATVAITTSTSCISSATMLCPSDNIQAKVTAAGAGATLTLQPGIYRMQTVTPLANQTFVGQPGAIMSGAKLLTGWTQSGSVWYVTGQTQKFADNLGICQSGTLCQLQEDVYRDNVLLTRVASLAAVVPGTFYFDYANQVIYVGDDPTGHILEGAATEYAFQGNAQGAGGGVTIQGLIIDKYATPANRATVGNTGPGDNWTISNNEIRYNHGAGVYVGRTGTQVLNNFIHHNGQLGIGGSGTPPGLVQNALIRGNEVSYNNTLGFTAEAGGMKFVYYATAITVRNNYVHDNYYVGIWSDGYCDQMVYDSNRVVNNTMSGITHEVSYGAVISNNVVTGNGFSEPGGSEGAGIHIMNSGGNGTVPSLYSIEIYGNTVSGNKNGIILLEAGRTEGPHTQNVSVHDNTVTLSANQTQDPASNGVRLYGGGDTRVWTTFNNHFTHNTYNLQTAVSAPFWWTSDHVSSALFTDAQWRPIPQDATGTFNR